MATPGLARPIALLAAGALALAACDGVEEPAPRTGTYETDPETGEVRASAPLGDGNATMLSGPAIAAPLPVDLPVMPGAEVTQATHVSSPRGLEIALIEMVTDENPSAVAAFYRSAAGEAGLESAFDMGGSAAVTYIALGEGRERLTMHAARARVAPDGSRAPIVDAGDEGAPGNRSDGSTVTYRDATAVQLHIVGDAAADEAAPGS
ncbi:hypothetical protein PF049_11540 [Erythrobacteraceae bacterium WH01K]|nr:hypothetical protein PF049_11540 [Erythrobacteraceae bacterium WH01K]